MGDISFPTSMWEEPVMFEFPKRSSKTGLPSPATKGWWTMKSSHGFLFLGLPQSNDSEEHEKNCARVKVLSLKNFHRREAHGSFWDEHVIYIYNVYIYIYIYLDKGWSFLSNFPQNPELTQQREKVRPAKGFSDPFVLLEKFTILFASPKNLSPGCPCGSCGPSSNVVPHTSASSESYGSWSSLFLLRSCVVLNSSGSLRSFHMNFYRRFCLLRLRPQSLQFLLLC